MRLRIFLACFFGAFLGALIAPRPGYLWWLGALSGGGVSYLSYNIREIIRAIPRAWTMASVWRPDWARTRRNAN